MLALVTGTLSDADATFTVLIEESTTTPPSPPSTAAYLTGTEALGSFTFADDGEAGRSAIPASSAMCARP
jgi:hypothetical protein